MGTLPLIPLPLPTMADCNASERSFANGVRGCFAKHLKVISEVSVSSEDVDATSCNDSGGSPPSEYGNCVVDSFLSAHTCKWLSITLFPFGNKDMAFTKCRISENRMNSTRLKRSLGLRDDGVAALLKKEYTIWDQCYLCQTGKHNYKLAVGKRDSCIVATFDVRKQKLIRGEKAATVLSCLTNSSQRCVTTTKAPSSLLMMEAEISKMTWALARSRLYADSTQDSVVLQSAWPSTV